MFHLSTLLATLLVVVACPGARAEMRRHVPLGLDLYMPIPEVNRLTHEKVALGRRLFFERRLSRTKKLACAGCHNPKRGFTDRRDVSVGVFGRKGSRNIPTLVNRGYGKSFFWDGRTTTLEEQVLKPIEDPKEMDMTLGEVVARLKKKRRYREEFQEAFGREINPADLARALASYLRTISSGDSPFDRYIYGDREALSEQARQGLRIFRGKGNCTACHLGPTFTDEQFHNTGVAWRDGKFLDDGRFRITGGIEHKGKFKTPTLREVGRTAPYMHDGSLTTLEDVVDFYDDGGRKNPNIDPELRLLKLSTEEKRLLVAFLKSLSGLIREGL